MWSLLDRDSIEYYLRKLISLPIERDLEARQEVKSSDIYKILTGRYIVDSCGEVFSGDTYICVIGKNEDGFYFYYDKNTVPGHIEEDRIYLGKIKLIAKLDRKIDSIEDLQGATIKDLRGKTLGRVALKKVVGRIRRGNSLKASK